MSKEPWTRERIKKVLDVLKEMKDFDRVPLPELVHKEFDIPMRTSRSDNVTSYFENYLKIQALPVDSVETIDGTIAHKDVVFPTSILKPFEIPEQYRPDVVEDKPELPAIKEEDEVELPLLKQD